MEKMKKQKESRMREHEASVAAGTDENKNAAE